jgi:microcystin-dependent protein
MLRKILFFAVLTITLPALVNAQSNNVGIGTTTPEPSAMLDISSTSQGLLVPRMTILQRDLIVPTTTSSEGLLIYQTDGTTGEPKGFYYWSASLADWLPLNQNTGNTPSGLISMWSGPINTIPGGWALCDGANGTPDLRNRFILSVQSSVENPGATGGTNDQSLTIANLPPHDHSINHTHTVTDPGHDHDILSYSSGSGSSSLVNGTFNAGIATTSSASEITGITVNPNTGNSGLTGSGTTFDNRPAFYKLAFIMKL